RAAAGDVSAEEHLVGVILGDVQRRWPRAQELGQAAAQLAPAAAGVVRAPHLAAGTEWLRLPGSESTPGGAQVEAIRVPWIHRKLHDELPAPLGDALPGVAPIRALVHATAATARVDHARLAGIA